MAAPATFFTDAPKLQMDDLLWRICDELQLSPSQYQQAVARYESVCQWLEAEGSAIASFRPAIYPQGSMRIGTTVKPIGHAEHDLDFVCEVNAPPHTFESPLQLLKLMETRFREHNVYSSILEVKNRCVRLNYANEFHMDILPACPDSSSGNGCLVVPDRKSEWWKPSNPKGYADWFEGRCDLAIQVLMAERARVLAKAEPIPDQEATAEKATLKRAVQLFKRWRDVRYEKLPDVAPISMVLTTLAAGSYGGQQSVSDSISCILDRIIALIETSRPRIYVLNPANLQEDLSERWADPLQYQVFVAGMYELHNSWQKAMGAAGIQNVGSALAGMFGEPVKRALTKQADHMQQLRENAQLRVRPAGIITALPASGLAMRSNTFHGK